MMKLEPGELILTDTSDEKLWLAARRQGIGASEIAAVAGLSTRRGAFDVFDAKVNATEFESSDEMRWGSFIEGRIIEWWARETGRKVGAGGLFRHKTHRWMMATPDAVVLEYPAATVVATVDAKNQGWHTHHDWDEDGAPIDYLAQITQQMLTVGVRTGHLVVALGGKPPVGREIGLDEDFAGQLIELGAKFWADLQAGKPPPVDGSKAASRYLKRKYPNADPTFFADLTDSDVAMLTEKVAIDEQIKGLEEMSEELENLIKDRLGVASVGVYNGNDMVTWKTVQRAGYTVNPGQYRKFHIPASIKRELSRGASD